MCGRYVMAKRSLGELAPALPSSLELTQDPFFDYHPSWNIAPTSTVPMVVERYDDDGVLHRELHPARWGLIPRWAKEQNFSAATFNARSETVTQKPAFREAVRHRRAVLPAEAYYEWPRTLLDAAHAPAAAGTVRKAKGRPYAVRPKDGSLLLFAAIYEWWRDPHAPAEEPAPWILSVSILTGPSPDPQHADPQLARLGRLHDRTPLAMTVEDAHEWITPGQRSVEELEPLLERLRGGVHDVARGWELYEVDPAVGSVRNNGPELMEPASPLLPFE
ncbi:SOS response-associated peptidase [Nesterenkonia flava]|uniref:Abasic site processing protein n=1 Tax=Nesterenkonia flava TaxID=469799 RepID=A0ABU1FST5_9MICC|nr:SOS response-associated peptidase [Nesterenkonia flava]MDR5711721.1 SOS response-associated peptidase [Nesterenkonia flava]